MKSEHIELPGYSFDKIEPVNKGMSSDKKYHITLVDSRELLLRISDAKEFERKHTEFCMMKRAYDSGAAVSEAIEFGRLADGRVYQLTEWLKGKDLDEVLISASEAKKLEYAEQTAFLLKKIHSIPCRPDEKTWKERFSRKVSSRLSELKCFSGVPEEICDIGTYLKENLSVLENCKQCFHHGDFNVGNLMLLDDGEIKAIDFNAYNSWYGEPVFETASILHDESVDAVFKTCFKTAYFKDSGLERVDELLLYYKAYHKLAGICEKLLESV